MVTRERFGNSGGWSRHSLTMGLLFGVFVMSFSVSAAEDDDYLKALSQEADKVGNTVTTEDAAASATAGARGGVSRQLFETELKEKYAGSAVFYSKLPSATQEEIFLEYRSGASIAELRKKIMDRFLHR
ncbi:MAG: hypothetical protein OQL28_16900 [Sedimenticola sp.]|nr:hypothetical protein [Sedimenticola sp.]